MYYGLYGPAEEAASHARRSIQLAPEASLLHVSAAWWLAIAGLTTEAVAILKRVGSGATDLRGTIATFFACALEGDEEGAIRAATAEMEQAISNEFLWAMMANAYALLGRSDDALRALRAAVRLGFINYPTLRSNVAISVCLGCDPEFQALLAEIKPRWKAVVTWERGLRRADTRTAPSNRQSGRPAISSA